MPKAITAARPPDWQCVAVGLSKAMPASVNNFRRSAGGLNRCDFGSSRSVHSKFFAPGMAPAHLLVSFSSPQCSFSERASTICHLSAFSASSSWPLVASRSARGLGANGTAAGTSSLSAVGNLPACHATHPPLRSRTSSTPQYRNSHQMRAASLVKLSSYTTTLESAAMPKPPIRLPHASASFPAPNPLAHSSWFTHRAPGMCPVLYFAAGRASRMTNFFAVSNMARSAGSMRSSGLGYAASSARAAPTHKKITPASSVEWFIVDSVFKGVRTYNRSPERQGISRPSIRRERLGAAGMSLAVLRPPAGHPSTTRPRPTGPPCPA